MAMNKDYVCAGKDCGYEDCDACEECICHTCYAHIPEPHFHPCTRIAPWWDPQKPLTDTVQE